MMQVTSHPVAQASHRRRCLHSQAEDTSLRLCQFDRSSEAQRVTAWGVRGVDCIRKGVHCENLPNYLLWFCKKQQVKRFLSASSAGGIKVPFDCD